MHALGVSFLPEVCSVISPVFRELPRIRASSEPLASQRQVEPYGARDSHLAGKGGELVGGLLRGFIGLPHPSGVMLVKRGDEWGRPAGQLQDIGARADVRSEGVVQK